LDLDADIAPAEVVQEGQTLQAVIIKVEEFDGRIELSRRATLKDRWPEFLAQHREGDVVHGRLQGLHPTGVFVRLEAGINGFVPSSELATWPVSKPEDLLWREDEVEAVITHVDARNRRLTLSIRSRMQQLAQATRIIEHLTEQKAQVRDVPTIPIEAVQQITPNERAQVGKIFIIDDDEGIRNGLVHWLQQRGYDASAVWPSKEIFSRIPSDGHGVLIIDIQLSQDDGLELVRALNSNGHRMHTCVMSSSEWLMNRSEDIRTSKVFQVFEKPLDKNEINRFLLDLAHGRAIQPAWQILAQRNETITESQILNLKLRGVPPLHRLQVALTKLAAMSHAEKCVLFFRDPVSQKISVLEEVGPIELQEQALYELKESPVKDVILEREGTMEGHATKNKRFDKLLKLLPFEACIGAPVEAIGEVHHALFFFHRKQNAFARVRSQYIELDAIWLSTILEKQALEQRLRTINPLLLSGELAVSLAHEVYNKVDSLELQVSTALLPDSPNVNSRGVLSGLHRSVLDLKTVVGSFQQMMRAKEIPVAFEINEVIRQAEALVRPLARKDGIKLDLRLAENLPYIHGNSVALQQVFFNIMLNAVQQMALKPDKHRLLEISSVHLPEDQSNFVVVSFIDTGPGIHRQLWNKIFDLGFSTRDGSGLGLFIARSLIESFRGQIAVERSEIPLGTTLVVKLPV
jgi:signal transduction histidine kinase/predicted RNA-binding protein with RPS1 domain/FixJ family two-component response regulator